MKLLLLADFPDGLAADLLAELKDEFDGVREATPSDVGELASEVRWYWPSDQLGGEAPVRLSLRRGDTGVDVVMPQWEDGDSRPPCRIDLTPYAGDGFAPVRFLFEGVETRAYEDGDVEVLGVKEMAYLESAETGNHLLFSHEEEE